MEDHPAMADALTNEEAETILATGERHLSSQDWNAAYELLHELVDQERLTGHDYGHACLILGWACLSTNAADAARGYFELAEQRGDSGHRSRARDGINQLQHGDAAVSAEQGGVAGRAEAEAVIVAAEEAFDRGDFNTAWQHYHQAYTATQVTRSQSSRIGVGMAAIYIQAGQAGEAEGYLQVAEAGEPSSAVHQRIVHLRDTLVRMTAADTLGADGVQRIDLNEYRRAGLVAFSASDFDGAYRYFLAVYESNLEQATDRARTAYNLGACCVRLHSYDAAHQYATEAAANGRSDITELARRLIADLENVDRSGSLAYEHTAVAAD
jgi:tetratricopeptide (TPR) repeat protein